jgi:hypothetical protein
MRQTQEIKSSPLHYHFVPQYISLVLDQLELACRRRHRRLSLRFSQWHRVDLQERGRQSQLQIPTHGLSLVQGMSVALS